MLVGKTDLAKENYRKALGLEPDHIQTLINLAGINITENNISEGKQLIDRVLKLEPENPQALAMKNRVMQK